MKRVLLVFLVVFSSNLFVLAQTVDSTQILVDSLESVLDYQTGRIELSAANALIQVPDGFRFLDQEQADKVLTDYWGNPHDETVLGMLVPEKMGVLADNSWAFILSYEELGFVNDDDASDINYDDLLKELQTDMEEENKIRAESGFEPVTLVGWASAPYYDQNLKILHWAKELKFREDADNTLNYNLRVLGRKGVLVINAVATMKELPDVKQSIPAMLKSVEFAEGYRYADFDSKVDDVAAYTIGGLVAGKVLAKVGFFAGILKFWKLIVLGIVAVGGAIWRFMTGRKKDDDQQKVEAKKELGSGENSEA
jgi:uncharacterized membrane-anchored protein